MKTKVKARKELRKASREQKKHRRAPKLVPALSTLNANINNRSVVPLHGAKTVGPLAKILSGKNKNFSNSATATTGRDALLEAEDLEIKRLEKALGINEGILNLLPLICFYAHRFPLGL